MTCTLVEDKAKEASDFQSVFQISSQKKKTLVLLLHLLIGE